MADAAVVDESRWVRVAKSIPAWLAVALAVCAIGRVVIAIEFETHAQAASRAEIVRAEYKASDEQLHTQVMGYQASIDETKALVQKLLDIELRRARRER